MPSRRQIRESAIQFLYCSDLEGGADPAALRGPFWEFLTETDRRNLQVATLRTVYHLAHGREERLAEFITRAKPALIYATTLPQLESLKELLTSLLALESSWSIAFTKLGKYAKSSEASSVDDDFANTLENFFQTDRDLAFHRDQFLCSAVDFPALRAHLEPVSASIRRLQRISERLRMVEQPENFPDQADLAKLRESKSEIVTLRSRTDDLVDAVLAAKGEIDAKLATIIENFSPARIDPVDRAILRLATYELIRTETPPNAIINEAIELAKRFGTNDSGRFVNGILDQVAKG
jgi:transcription antitermination protein NusB